MAGNEDPSSSTNKDMQPGQVIAPGSISTPPLAPAPQNPAPVVAPPDAVAPQPEPLPPPETQPETNGSFYHPDPQEDMPQASEIDPVSWTASEYVEHEKNGSWYMLLALAALVTSALVYLLTRDVVSSGVVIFGAIIMGVYAARPPRQVTYQLDASGLSIGSKHFGYNEFKSFAVVPEGGINSIIFVHHKRFAPLTTIYLDPQGEDQIVNALSSRLPMEEHKIDAVEHLMRRIRF